MGQKHSVNIDISFGVDSPEVSSVESEIYSYNDGTVVLREDISPDSFKGYKIYSHTRGKDTLFHKYSLGKILYRGVELKGLTGDRDDISRHTRTVYGFYWESDNENLLPLLIAIAIKEGHTTRYECYKRSIDDEWRESEIRNSDIVKVCRQELARVNEDHSNVIILNLDESLTHSAHPYLYPQNRETQAQVGKFPKLHAEKSDNCPAQSYTRVHYKFPDGRKLRILSAYWGHVLQSFNNEDILKEEWNEVFVYLSSGGLGKPLLIELVRGDSGGSRNDFDDVQNGQNGDQNGPLNDHNGMSSHHYDDHNYYHYDNDGFSAISGVNRRNLLGLLDQLGCRYNGSHPFDISKTYSHKCPYCNVYFNVQSLHPYPFHNEQRPKGAMDGGMSSHHNDHNGEAAHSLHQMANGRNFGGYTCALGNVKIGRIKNGHIPVTLPSVSFPLVDAKSISMYHSSCASRFLICLEKVSSGNLWFRKERSNEWKLVDNLHAPPTAEDSVKIGEIMNDLCTQIEPRSVPERPRGYYGHDEYPGALDAYEKNSLSHGDQNDKPSSYRDEVKHQETGSRSASRIIGLCTGVAVFIILGGIIGISDRFIKSRNPIAYKMSDIIQRHNFRQIA